MRSVRRTKDIHRRKLRAEMLEDRHMLATVTWDGGGGDLNWHNAANWNINRVPNGRDEAVVSNVSGVLVVDQAAASVDTLTLSNSTIDTRGTARFTVIDNAELDNASILASNGGQVAINDRSIRNVGFGRVTMHADGTGSLISAPEEVFLNGEWSLLATNGGHISLAELISSSGSIANGPVFRVTGGSRLSLGTSTPFAARIGGEIVIDDSDIFAPELKADRLSGNGTVHGSLVDTKEIYLNGPLSITGDVEGDSAGDGGFLTFGISGPNDVTTLDVGGAALLDDFTLQVDLRDGFVPSLGDSFEFLNAASTMGDFSRVQTNARGTGIGFEVSTNSGTAVVTAVVDSGPQVTGIEVTSLTESLTAIVVSFDEPISGDTILNSGITLEGPNGPITDFSVRSDVFDSSNIRIDMHPPAPAGEYSLTVHPIFTDINGNVSDQDRDGIGGETIDDAYSEVILIEDNDGPFIVQADDTRVGRGTIGELEVSFSSTTDVDSFTSDDLTVVDSKGQQIDVLPTVQPQSLFGLNYTVTFANPVWREGEYEIRIGPDIFDINGNAMDQDMDGVYGEVVDDTLVLELEVKRLEPIPGVSGNGVFTEVFFGIHENFISRPPFFPPSTTESAELMGRSPDATGMVGTIDFPNSADFVSTSRGATIDEFFSGTFPLTEEQKTSRAGVFMLRNTFYLIVPEEADLNPNTPEIDIRTGVGSDDGYLLKIDDELVSMNGDRSWRYTWDSVEFQEPGIYPVELIYSANEIGQAGLEFAWETATSGGEQIVPTDFLYFDNSLLFAGDADLNGTVNSTDLGLLLNNFNDDSGLGWGSGNFNDDVSVDSADLGLLLNNFGEEENLAATVALATAAFADLDSETGSGGRLYMPVDALRIINHLNQPGYLAPSEFSSLDFDGNGEIVPQDALMVINRLVSQKNSANIAESETRQIRDVAIQRVLELKEHEWRISGPKLNWIP